MTHVFALLAALSVSAQTPGDTADSAGQALALAAVARGAQRSMVVVEHWLRYDRGQYPRLSPDRTGTDGARGNASSSGVDLVREQRPLQSAGFLLSRDRVLTRDIALHERFVESVRVRFGGRTVNATVESHALAHDAIVLKITDSLPGAVALRFDTAATAPLSAVRYVNRNGAWAVLASAFGGSALIEDTTAFMPVAPPALVVGRDGAVAGLVTENTVALDNSWKGSPLAWDWISAAQRAERIDGIKKAAEECLVHVKLSMRSPKLKGGGEREEWRSSRWRSENISMTEAHAVGVCLARGRVLVLAELTAEATARLERIEIFDRAGAPHEATFEATLKDFGALVVVQKEQKRPYLNLAATPFADTRNAFLLKAHIAMAGKQRIAFYWHDRVRALENGYRGARFPAGDPFEKNVFLFTAAGEILSLPLSLRQRGGEAQGEPWRDGPPTWPVEIIAPVLADLKVHSDTSSVPLVEDQETRIAWMGIVLQPLDRELARAKGVAEQTDDGSTGALVAHVYDNSPAAKAGIKQGMVILRINPDNYPRPITVKIENPPWDEPFPWDRLDDIPEDMIERAPPPWPQADDGLARLLTELGFGRKFSAEFVHDGVAFSRDGVVTESPPHYASARKYRNDKLGLTVRELTFEVRRHFRKSTDDPGVIVSRVEPGSRASVAGIKPYEIITHVNGKKIASVSELEKLFVRADEVRLSVERLGKSRQVRIRFEGK